LNPAVTLGFGRPGVFLVAPLDLTYSANHRAHSPPAPCSGFVPAKQVPWRDLPAGSDLQSFILEFVLTFLLMLTILNVSTGAKEKGDHAGIAVGAVIGLKPCSPVPFAARP